jgi:hypothetical protein
LKTTIERKPKTASKTKAGVAQAENLLELCSQRLALEAAYNSRPEDRDAIGAALDENHLAQKLARRTPSAIARSARALAK